MRAIEKMHKSFGVCGGHTCGECTNLRPISSCMVYGDVPGGGFKPYDLACGHFCVSPSSEEIIYARRKRRAVREEDGELQGQMRVEDYL